MPWPRPTLLQLRTQASQDITSSGLPGADGFLRRAWLPILGWVQAGMAYLFYGFIDWISRMSVPFTAEDEFLAAWAGLKGVTRLPPTLASGNGVQFGGVNGTPIPSGTSVIRSDLVAFVTTAAQTVSGGLVTVPVQAIVPGSAGNCATGTAFQLGTGISGINATGTSTVDFTNGTDIESDASLRTRMLLAYSAPPQGGAASDYVEWALQAQGVTRAWCNPLQNGAGTVVTYVMMDVTEAIHSGFPQGSNGVATAETRDAAATGDQLTVANFLFPLRPATALSYVFAPTSATQNFTVAGLVPNTTPMQNAIKSAIASMLFLKGTPLGNGTTTTYDQSDVDGAISAVPGVISFRVTAPSFPVALSLGQLPVLGTVTFV